MSERLLRTAEVLLQQPVQGTSGLWPRAVALLTRQALEEGLAAYWRTRAPGTERCPMRAQLLCLRALAPRSDLAESVAYLWTVLSSACHYHAYELAPSAGELQTYLEETRRVMAGLAGSGAAPRAPAG